VVSVHHKHGAVGHAQLMEAVHEAPHLGRNER